SSRTRAWRWCARSTATRRTSSCWSRRTSRPTRAPPSARWSRRARARRRDHRRGSTATGWGRKRASSPGTARYAGARPRGLPRREGRTAPSPARPPRRRSTITPRGSRAVDPSLQEHRGAALTRVAAHLVLIAVVHHELDPVHAPLLEHPVCQQRVHVPDDLGAVDRKSTRLNSSHVAISYAVFC